MARSKKKLHLLIIPSWYKSPETPVLGTFFEEQARAMQKAGFKVGIIYPEYHPPGSFLTIDSHSKLDFYMDREIPTFHVKASGGIPKFRKLSYHQFNRAVDKVYKSYEETFGKPDLIHAHSVFHAGIAAHYLSVKHNIPLVITEHLTAYLMGYIDHPTDIAISKKIFEEADASIIVSRNFRKDLEGVLNIKPKTFTVIHNLVNDLFFETFTPMSYQSGETFRFFTNSFLLPRKNIAMIIDAIHVLLQRNIPVNLVIGGEGPEEENLKAQVKKLNLEPHVTFTGKLWREQVKQELDQCHAFVLASQYETFGVVLIESLACGRPVVCTNSGGPLDFIHHEQGILVEEHTAKKLADGMEKLMHNYHSYDQQALVAYCHEHFRAGKIAEQIIKLYHSVLKAKNRLPKNTYHYS